MIRKVSAEDITIRGNGTGMEYMCPTRHFVYIFLNPVFQVSTAKNEINLFNNHILIVAPVTFAPAGAMTPSADFLFLLLLHNICNSSVTCTGIYIPTVWPVCRVQGSVTLGHYNITQELSGIGQLVGHFINSQMWV